MDQTEPEWQLYRTLLAALQEGSLSATARLLGLSQPTVGRHIDALEAALGMSLFTRSPSGLLPTETALAIRPYAERMQATAEALRRAATANKGVARGTVRITVAELMGVEVLPPILTAIRHTYPAITLELVLSDRVENILNQEADIAVRMLDPTQEALVARKIGRIEIGAYAHPDYLKRHPAPRSIDELAGHHLIGFDHESAYIRRMLSDTPALRRSMFALRTDSNVAQLAAIRAGFGLGFCQLGLARREPRLRRVLPELTMILNTWLVMHEDMRHNAACRAVFDMLADGLAAYIKSQHDR
ncbi:LysR family transcriptional regulator [Dyella sp. GSA-30]|uniref:LysR family transcriptional regulator n=1 Tax=Dyella sp. GSA-30 TaxID=2994496 RepID=UPI002490FD96|nr:LysR family transcriptional regulator [Dyella sp. GSA-30]BDU19624.1 LysR family transcriptional regulator [Dyella sp. GSA-30]